MSKTPATKPSRFLRAYYYTFDPTGDDRIDAILEAIAMAGKAYHSTSEWQQPVDHRAKTGPTYVDSIQEAANTAAGSTGKLVEALEFYADRKSWISPKIGVDHHCYGLSPALADEGKQAKAALAKQEPQP